MFSERYKSILIFFLIFSTFLFFCVKISFFSDDAFISYRYAKNFVHGYGLVYNPEERVEGYTNFLWVIISGLLLYLNIDPLIGTRVFSIVSSLSILIFTYLVATKIFKVTGTISFLSPALLALNPGFVLWTYSGMETTFFTLCVTLGCFFTLKFIKNKDKFLIYTSIIFSIASLTRPEGVLFFFLNFLFLMIVSLKNKSNQSFLDRIKKFIIPILIFTLLYGIYFVWRFSYYGFFFPNTFYAKTGFENQILRGLYYCFKFYRESLAMGLLLIFPAYLVLKEKSDERIQYILFVLSGYLLYLILIGGDNLLVQRLFVPVMPIIFILIQLGVNKFFKDFSIFKNIQALIIILIIFSSVFALIDNRSFPMLGVSRTLFYYENLIKAGKWLKENSKPDETVAVESAGIIPYFSELKSYDRLGLNDLYISRKGKYGIGERDKSDEDYMLWEKKPTYFVDAFPTLYKKEKPDLIKENLVYRYNSVLIGRGVIEEKPGIPEEGDLYFNFYKREDW